MYLLLNMGIFHCYVSLPEGNGKVFWFPGMPLFFLLLLYLLGKLWVSKRMPVVVFCGWLWLLLLVMAVGVWLLLLFAQNTLHSSKGTIISSYPNQISKFLPFQQSPGREIPCSHPIPPKIPQRLPT